MASTTLRTIKPGGRCRVKKIHILGEMSKRLTEMGVTPGAEVIVERIAPMGDPIDILVKGYHLSIRLDEAGGIDVETL